MGWKEAHRTAAGTGQRPPGRGPSDAPPRESSSHSRTPAACTIATPAPPEARPPEGISEARGGRPAAEPSGKGRARCGSHRVFFFYLCADFLPHNHHGWLGVSECWLL